MLDIGETTTWLCTTLGTYLLPLNILVGDGVAPEEGGWPEGSPNTVSTFVNYVVVKPTGTATPQPMGTPLCDTVMTALWLPYSVDAYSPSRVSADHVASEARSAVKKLWQGLGEFVSTGDFLFNPSQITIETAVGALRDDSTYPKLWSAATGIRIAGSRVRPT